MPTSELISKLINLQEQANAHNAEYQKLQHVPGSKTKASAHQRKAVRLRSRIQEIIHEIAADHSGLYGN